MKRHEPADALLIAISVLLSLTNSWLSQCEHATRPSVLCLHNTTAYLTHLLRHISHATMRGIMVWLTKSPDHWQQDIMHPISQEQQHDGDIRFNQSVTEENLRVKIREIQVGK